MRIRRMLCVALAVGACVSVAISSPIRVDINPDNGRRDIAKPKFVDWRVKDGREVSTTINGVGVTIRADGGSLGGMLWKGGIDTGAVLTNDGIAVRDGSAMQLTLAGLSPGKHSIVLWLSGTDREAGPAVSVRIDGRAVTERLPTTTRVEDDLDAARVYAEFESTGKDVVIQLAAAGRAASPFVLNGFAIDVADPSLQANRPRPLDGDEHAEPSPTLSWTPSEKAVSQHVYFGTSADAVAHATPESPEFRGELKGNANSFEPGDLNHMLEYFWRVDSVVAGQARPVRGEVWRLRVRHLAFPGAEGYGRFARGGRGGRVIEVTSLEDSGPGTLREAIEAEGPRTIVFRVGGTIRLKDRLVIRNPYVTIAGQTAPGDGIALRDAAFGMSGTHDVIMRFIRLRVGDESGKTWDGMGFGSSDHCIIDHCSIAWSIDEGVSSRGAKNITFQRNIIAEPLNMSIHDHYVGTGKGHGFAGSISGNIGSFHHNLIAHAAGRNWSLAGGLTQGGKFAGYLDIRQNVVYNWNHRTNDGGVRKLNLVNNYYIPGPATRVFHLLIAKMELRLPDDVQQYFVAGNVMEGRDYDRDNWQNGGVIIDPRDLPAMKLSMPFCESFITERTAREAYESVMSDVGANIPHLDEIDRRAIENTKNRTTTFKGSKTGLPGIPDSQNDVGGFPVYRNGPAPADEDHDGMADWWELEHGLDPTNPEDRNQIGEGGYTRLENYLNWIVENGGLEPKRKH